jgi:hypothetical protein
MFYIDVEDAQGNKLGTGPIRSATGWRVTRPMDGAGSWSFTAPLADVKLAQATPRRYAHIYAYVAGTYQWVGGGPIDAIKTSIGADGTVMADASGSDMLRELAWRSVGSLTVSDGAGGPTTHAAALAAIMAYAPAGWGATPDPAPGWDQLYGQFGGETVLAALANIAQRSRSHYYLSGRRVVTFGSTFGGSGVRCVAAAGQLGTGQAAITGLEVERSSYDLVSRVIPVGAGQSRVALTLRATGRTAPAGYTLNTAANYLRNDGVESAYGRCERVVSFKDISPLSSTTADVISAANVLYDAAKYWLDQHSAPVTAYRVSVAECPVLVRPLQTVRVVWRDPAQGTAIDADLYVLGVEWTGDASGVRTAGLTVADAPLWPESDVSAVVENIAQGQIYQALPQLNANSYVIAYSKNVDDATEANFRFRFDDDTVQLVRVVFDFQILALESTVKTVGASSTTAAASGDHTHSVTITGHTHSVTLTDHNHSITLNDHYHAITLYDHTHGVTIGSHQHTVDLPGHTHGVPNHQHNIQITLGSSPTYPVGFSAAGTSGGLVSGVSGSSFNLPTNASSGATTTNSGGSSTQTSSSGGGTSVTSGGGGGTSTTSGAGGATSTTSGAGGATTATSSSGGGTTATSASGGSHTHSVTPTITTTYGIYRDDAGNVFALADLEYSLDGSTWYGFAVGVNGYASLGGGWHRVDLTALLQDATTLRPLSNNNTLQLRRKAAGAIKKATIDAQLGIRNIIQALALN